MRFELQSKGNVDSYWFRIEGLFFSNCDLVTFLLALGNSSPNYVVVNLVMHGFIELEMFKLCCLSNVYNCVWILGYMMILCD